MRKSILVLLGLAVCLFSGAVLTSAQNYTGSNAWGMTCPAPNGDYTRSGVYPRYEYRNRRLVLVDIQTNQIVQELETSLTSSSVRGYFWSPDCHYLATAVLASGSDVNAVVWDVTTKQRVAELPASDNYGVYWNSDSRYLVVDTNEGAYLYDAASDQTLLLSPPVDHSIEQNHHPFRSVKWDNQRNQLIAVQMNGDIVAYDLASGSVAGFFHDPDTYGRHAFVLSRDNSKIIVYSELPGIFLAIWDRDTMVETQVNMRKMGAIYVDLSTNNRYLAVGNHGMFRIWDLENLPTDVNDRLPSQFLLAIYSGSIEFVDNDHLKIHWHGKSLIYDIHTGVRVS